MRASGWRDRLCANFRNYRAEPTSVVSFLVQLRSRKESAAIQAPGQAEKEIDFIRLE